MGSSFVCLLFQTSNTYHKTQSVEYVKLDDVSVISWYLFPFLEKLSSLVCHNIMYLAHKHQQVFYEGKFRMGEFIAYSNISPFGSLLTLHPESNGAVGSLTNLSAF